MADDSIIATAPPWKLKGTVYMVTFYNKQGVLPDFAYSPLESASPFAGPESGKHRGGISQIQVIRYTESPVGPYDELIVCPGFFDYTVSDRGELKTRQNARITRIYVSQKHTCWNGRKNWNIPKHLARFDFTELPNRAINVKVYPHDTAGDAAETSPADTPLFNMTIRPMRWVPSFPLSLGWLRYLGIDASVVQPPLPQAGGSQQELPGTERWCKIMPVQSTRRASLAWADMSQRDEKGTLHAQHDNFWPAMGRWQLALQMEHADIDFGLGEHWDPPPAKL